jgi:hypothetical protein
MMLEGWDTDPGMIAAQQARAYIVKLYDPLGRVPDRFLTARGTWTASRDHALIFATERLACESAGFKARTLDLRELDTCVERWAP